MSGPTISAAGRAPLAFYDGAVALTMRERVFRARLADLVLAGDPAVVVEVGAGTGSLAVRLAGGSGGRAREVVAIDPDPVALRRARAKRGAGAVRFVEGRAEALPLPDAHADRVVFSLVLHHIAHREDREAALAEAARVLRPGGRLHIADWGPPRGVGLRLLGRLDGPGVAALAGGEAPRLLQGWEQIGRDGSLRTAWGQVEFWSASPPRPGGGSSSPSQ